MQQNIQKLGNPINAIIFDMDGVIVDSEPLHVEMERQTCRDFGIKIPLSEWEHFKGITGKAMWEYIVKNFTDGSISISKLRRHRINLFLKNAPEKILLFSGVLEFIKKAKEKSITLALTTSSVKDIKEIAFNKFDLHSYFDVVVTGDQITKGKPDPEPYTKTVQKLNLPASECLVIEDSTNGILSAKAAGCIAVGITTSFPREKLLEAGANYVVNSFKELSRLV